MNRGVSQMMEEGPPAGFWRLNDMRPQFTQIMSSSPLLPSSSSSSSSTNASTTSGFPRQYSTLPSNSFPSNPWHDSQDLPESWSQLLLAGYIGEEEKGNFPSFLGKLENWDHVGLSNLMNVKHESSKTNRDNYGENCDETQQAAATTTTAARSSWSQHMLPVSSPSPMSSCITSFNTNILDFSNSSNNNVEGTHHPRTECDSTASGSSFKKARVQASSPQSTFKVRKEKLGDRITVLHQLVSPFGKTDTASVLLEAIGYIRFLHGQIEALSSPYLGNALGNRRHHSVPQGERNCIFPEDPGQLLDDACIKRRGTCNQKDANEEAKKDLKSRGLCLVPISCTLHVETGINGADYWAPASLGGGLR